MYFLNDLQLLSEFVAHRMHVCPILATYLLNPKDTHYMIQTLKKKKKKRRRKNEEKEEERNDTILQ